MSLTPQEQETIDVYNTLFVERWKAGYFWKDFWAPEFQKFQELLPSGKVLEIGCGIGRDARLFSENDYDYTGIDLSDAALDITRERFPRLDLQKMSMYDLQFPEGSFDAFWSAATLIHAPKSRVEDVLSEIRRVVKPGGVGFLVMQEGDGEQTIKDRFYSLYGFEEFTEILKKNHFEILESWNDVSTPDRPKPTSGDNWLIYFVRV